MFTRIYKFISLYINRIFIDPSEKNFIKHNKALFKNSENCFRFSEEIVSVASRRYLNK
jgi:hypothetical protein